MAFHHQKWLDLLGDSDLHGHGEISARAAGKFCQQSLCLAHQPAGSHHRSQQEIPRIAHLHRDNGILCHHPANEGIAKERRHEEVTKKQLSRKFAKAVFNSHWNL